MEKPKILSQEQLNAYCKNKQGDDCSKSPYSCLWCLCEAQRDADVSLFKQEIEKLGVISDEKILDAENQFIEKAKSNHKELGHKFISGEITSAEYDKQSMEAWVGFYKEIAEAQIQDIKDKVRMME